MKQVQLTLTGQREKQIPRSVYEQTVTTSLKGDLLLHQWRTWQALREYPIVINTYNTGTGKTRASLLHLFDINNTGRKVLFIAPTNALIAQHVKDIEQFVAENKLSFRVIAARASDLTALGSELRRGETLKRLIQNYREFLDGQHNQPPIFVVNPDIFYYALYFQYGHHDKRNVAEQFIAAFDYIVIDELHYYNTKQIANFLFAFGLFKQFNYFDTSDKARRICILSATLRSNIMERLHNLFPHQIAAISPQTEPPDTADYPTVATLAPLEVTIVGGTLQEWIDSPDHPPTRWINAEEKDGAIISSSLARINELYVSLRARIPEAQMGRITGPESEIARNKAAARKLILATPTVDIGYNFDKFNKPDRQNIDFVACDARFRDELVQRIGRAGRVLRKTKTDIPSQAVIALEEGIAGQFEKYAGQTLTRTEFRSFLETLSDLPPKHANDDYLFYYALQELAYPILELEKMTSGEEDRQVMRSIYDEMVKLIAPPYSPTFKSHKAYYRKLDERRKWLEAYTESSKTAPPNSAQVLSDYYRARGENSDQLTTQADVMARAVEGSLFWSQYKPALRDFVESQLALSKALFNFRDSQETFTGVFYDPSHLFSSETVNTYDILHLLRNYELTHALLITSSQFAKVTGIAEADLPIGDFFLQRLIRRDIPAVIRFQLSVVDGDDDREDFCQMWVGKPIALKGITPRLALKQGNVIAGGVPYAIEMAFHERVTVCLLVPDTFSALTSRLSKAAIYSYPLNVIHKDSSEQQFMLYLGLNAFEAHAWLKRQWTWKKAINNGELCNGPTNDEPFIV